MTIDPAALVPASHGSRPPILEFSAKPNVLCASHQTAIAAAAVSRERWV